MKIKQSSHEPIMNDIFSYVPSNRNIQKINCNQTLNSKLNIDEPLKAIKVINSCFFCSWINRHHSSWLLAYLPVIALKAAAKCDTDLTRIPTLFTFSDPLQVLKSLLMSGVESGVLQ